MQGRARGHKGERKTYHITMISLYIYIYLYICIACLYLIDYLYPPLPGDASYISWWEEQVPLQNIHLY